MADQKSESTTPESPSEKVPQSPSSKRRRRRRPGKPRFVEHETGSGESEGEVTSREGEGETLRGREVRRQFHEARKPVSISVVIPLYNEEESLEELFSQLRSVLHRMRARYELIFVDDGSWDKSFKVLGDLKRRDTRVRIVRFRRNFGKSAALAVGFEKASNDIVITMDADLQDDPAEIPNLIRKIEEGYDLVSGWKKVRHDPISKTIPSRFFNFVTSVLTGIRLHDFNCGLKAYRKEVVKTVRVYGELHRYVPVLAKWEGFTITETQVKHRRRKYGKTKFGFGRFWKGFLDLVTVLFTTRYFRRPLHLFGFWGVIAMLAGIIIDAWLVVEWALGLTSLGNRPLFLGGILLIIVGIQSVSIGLLGEMISKTRQAEEQYSIREYIH